MANLIKPAKYPTASMRRPAPKPYVSLPPKPFTEYEPRCKRAIVCPWLYVDAAWDELRYSLRSIDKFFEDKECPIYVIGNKAPPWLAEGGRVEFIHVPEYEESREAGLWAAWQIGLQIADEVCWTNDDIYFLKPTGWDDLKVAMTSCTIEDEHVLRASDNNWRSSLGDAAVELRKRGFNPVYNFATHTPYLFEREKSLEIMRSYYIAFCGTLETLYHNHHGTPHQDVHPHKCMALPAAGSPRYLNNKSRGPDERTKNELILLLSTKAPWEKSHIQHPKKPDIPIYVSMATFPPRIEGLARVISDILPQCDKLRIYLNGYDEKPECIPDDNRIEYVLAGPNSPNPDIGSHGKWHWLGGEDCYYLTIDDDIFYPDGYVEHMVDGCVRLKDRAIVSLHGYQFRFLRDGVMNKAMPIPRMRDMRPYHKAYPEDYVCHALGSGVMCCRPSAINLSKEAFGGAIHSGDDEDLALWAQKNSIPMVRIRSPLGVAIPNDTEWRKEALHARTDFRISSDKKLRSYTNWKLHKP